MFVIAIGQRMLFLLIVMAHVSQILKATSASFDKPQTVHYLVITFTMQRGLNVGNLCKLSVSISL